MAAAVNPASPVPLDTIPISPEGGNTEPGIKKEQTDPSALDAENVTVFHNANNFNVKHPLANTWTLWFTKPAGAKVGVNSATLSELVLI